MKKFILSILILIIKISVIMGGIFLIIRFADANDLDAQPLIILFVFFFGFIGFSDDLNNYEDGLGL